MKTLIFLTSIIFSLIASSDYIGDQSCKQCHKKEYTQWKGSHHDLAMQIADETSVLGDFNNAQFISKANIKTTFFKKDDKFIINTDGPDGKLQDYEVSHVFGVYPLQQYMVKFPKGKIQVLDIAWDSRSQKKGGQRWYHLHPNESITSKSVLHWSGPNMNWNYMCADCHSTNLKKNYNPKTKAFNTKYDVINVSCESCHGPASSHVKNGSNLSFKINKNNELDICAKCHSRRAPLDDTFQPGDKFSEHYKNVKLSQEHYFSDGKIKDEVYVYNSFLQSKMYAKGVTCSDCHNPHSLKRKAVGEKVCYQCHTPKKYTQRLHTKHKVGSSGSSCISCHMPSRIYMGVDDRNDHSFRIPRPDLSISTSIPNACNNCHTDKNALWATNAMKKWYGEIPVGYQNFSHALDALHVQSTEAQNLLFQALKSENPTIAKATLVNYLGVSPSEKSYNTLLKMLDNDNIDIKLSALEALENYPSKYKLTKLFELITSDNKLIRIESARQLSNFSMEGLDLQRSLLITKAIDEYKDTLLFNADRAEVQNELAFLYLNQKKFYKAETAYKEAIRISKKLVPTYINLAYFYQMQKNEVNVNKTLLQGLNQSPKNPDLHHVLGLHYVRVNKYTKALKHLKKAAKLSTNNIQYQYIYAVAVSKTDITKSIKILKKALKIQPGNVQVKSALEYYLSTLELK